MTFAILLPQISFAETAPRLLSQILQSLTVALYGHIYTESHRAVFLLRIDSYRFVITLFAMYRFCKAFVLFAAFLVGFYACVANSSNPSQFGCDFSCNRTILETFALCDCHLIRATARLTFAPLRILPRPLWSSKVKNCVLHHSEPDLMHACMVLAGTSQFDKKQSFLAMRLVNSRCHCYLGELAE